MTLEHANVRWLALHGAANARVVVPGVLLRSDNLQSLTSRDVAVLVEDQALEVVLDLRTEVEVELEGPGPITLEPRVCVVQAYLSYLIARPDSIVGSIRTIASADGAVLVHCAAGKDRTGVVVALALDAAGVDRSAIISDYLATTERIEAIMARLVRSPTYRSELEGHDPQRHAPVPGTIERVFELIDESFDGSAAWLSANGLSDAELDQLRTRVAADGA
jgi:hypothetical protein